MRIGVTVHLKQNRTHMARKTKEAALETRTLIVDAAERVFYEQGIACTSLADIAHAAGVTRGAIYWHFKNKGEVFAALFERVKLPLEELALASLDAREPDPLGRIRDKMVHCLRDTTRDPSSRRVLEILFHKCEFTAGSGDLRTRHEANVNQGRANIEGGLRNAVTRQQLPHDLDLRRAAVLLHGMITGMLWDWLFTPDCIDLPGEAEGIVDAWLDMLRVSPTLRIPRDLTDNRMDHAPDKQTGKLRNA